MIDQIIDYNKAFVEQKGYEKYLTDKYPANSDACRHRHSVGMEAEDQVNKEVAGTIDLFEYLKKE